MTIYNILRDQIVDFIKKEFGECDTSSIVVEAPKDSFNGDLSSNAAMVLAGKLNENPRAIAIKIKDALASNNLVAHIEIAGPGFLNFTIQSSVWQNNILSIIEQGSKYGLSNIGNSKKVNIEYVSANPTGPMHIGHARCAVYGDALANLLLLCGYDVTKEYYINDAGSQIDCLMRTALIRYREIALNENIDIPEGLYPGEYLIPVGQKLLNLFGDKLLKMAEDDAFKLIKKHVIDAMMDIIKKDLLDMGIKHDVFFSETTLHDENKIDQVVKQLEKKDLVYRGVLPPPKGKPQENWESKEQLLFKTTEFGDEMDRPLQKADGEWSYFAADIAYAANKIGRGFDAIVVILGADHGGYVKRMQAVIKALSDDKVESDVKLCQLVNYLENGDLIKMSKRAGTFTTVRDVMNEVGKDIIRFIMLTRKNDASLDFDLAKVKEQSKDNPVFYVNYAHVRAISIVRNAMEAAPGAYDLFKERKCDLSLLSSEEEIGLMKLLTSWPKVVEGAAQHFEPHRIAFYLQNLAASFHALWNLGKENNDYRFISPGEEALTAARLMLVDSVRIVVRSGLEVIGASPMDKM